MKRTLSKIAFIGSAAIMLLVGLGFMVIDAKLIFCGDWLIYADNAFGLIQLILREIIWFALIACLPLTIIYLKKKTVEMRMTCMVYAIFVFVMGVTSALIFKVDAGKPLFYYMLPAAILPSLYVLSFYFYEAAMKNDTEQEH